MINNKTYFSVFLLSPVPVKVSRCRTEGKAQLFFPTDVQWGTRSSHTHAEVLRCQQRARQFLFFTPYIQKDQACDWSCHKAERLQETEEIDTTSNTSISLAPFARLPIIMSSQVSSFLFIHFQNSSTSIPNTPELNLCRTFTNITHSKINLNQTLDHQQSLSSTLPMARPLSRRRRYKYPGKGTAPTIL